MLHIFVLLGGAACAFGQFDLPLSERDDISQLYTRDAEAMPPPYAFGAKYMTGGAGEGYQALQPDGEYEFRQQVKSDSELPAYCNPPNPCPKGFSAEQNGCMPDDQFENTAAFSKQYQESQNCLCDEEHMRSCPNQAGQEGAADEDFDAALDAMLQKNQTKQADEPKEAQTLSEYFGEVHKKSENMDNHPSLVSKKGDRLMDPLVEHFPRKRRSTHQQQPGEDYAWLKGEKLIRVAKKG